MLAVGSFSQFYIRDMIWNASMKSSAWLIANACVIRSIVIKDRNTDVFMPQ